MKNLISALIFAAVLVTCLEAKSFPKCALAKELSRQGFPRDLLADWTCLVLSESNGNTLATNKNNNGSKDYGLFQVSTFSITEKDEY